jgi:DNA polymerase III subunit delta'
MASLLDQQLAGRLHHAIVLAGPQGIGKATLAFHIARSIFDAEGDADAARKIHAGSHSALLHVARGWNEDAKRFRQEITVDDVRRVSRFLGSTSATGGTRVIIIDAADDMNRNAANALLKNLEEPPAKVHYFLIAHQPSKLLATIRSRCRIQQVPALEAGDLLAALEQAGLAPQEASAIAPLADGSVRRGIIMAREGGNDIADALNALFSTRPMKTADAVALASAGAAKDGAMRRELLFDLLQRRIAAEAAASLANRVRALRLADLHAALQARRAVADAYNLDPWLEIHNALERTHRTLWA